MSQTDLKKCREIFLEFLYYLFDSVIIPLVRAHFHVTETNVHRQRLFFFRHNVWRSLVEPALASLKLNMLEEIKPDEAHKILDSRVLGFSRIRLLPKEAGIRPITNLRRRAVQKKSKLLGSSINSVLAPIHSVLTYEKVRSILEFISDAADFQDNQLNPPWLSSVLGRRSLPESQNLQKYSYCNNPTALLC